MTGHSKPPRNIEKQQSRKSFDKELSDLLNQADKITLDDLEFDKLFKEQGAILCDIRNILNNQDNAAACRLINKASGKQMKDFNNLYKDMKNEIITRSSKSEQTKPRRSISRHRKPSLSKSKPKQPRRSISRRSKLRRSISRKTKHMNSRYPIVILKKTKKQPNVLYLNNVSNASNSSKIRKLMKISK